MRAASLGGIGPIAVLGDGLAAASRAARLLREASLYVGFVFVILVGAGVVAELGILSWAPTFEPSSAAALATARDAVQRANLVLVVGILGCLAAIVDGNAIAMTLLAGRVLGLPVTVVDGLRRARQVFWRLLGAAIATSAAQLILTAIYRSAIGLPALAGPGELPILTVEPLPALLVSVPLVLTSASIILADDGLGAAFRRSIGLVRRARGLAVALALFALLAGIVEGLAAGAAFDLMQRVADLVDLDLAQGPASFIASSLVGLALVMALGSLVLTVAAVIAAPQAIAFVRLGSPLGGLARVVAQPPIAADVAMPPMRSTEAAMSPMPSPEEPAPSTAPEPFDAGSGAPAEPAVQTAPEQLPPGTASVAPAAAPVGHRPGRVRWITVPMRLTAVVLWVIALSSVVIGPPS